MMEVAPILHMLYTEQAFINAHTKGKRNYRVRTFLQESCWATLAHFSDSVTTCINACSNSDSGNFFCSASCNNDLTSVRSENQRQSYQKFYFWLLLDHVFHSKFSIIYRHQLLTMKPKLHSNIDHKLARHEWFQSYIP
jgi:hypothetical protein